MTLDVKKHKKVLKRVFTDGVYLKDNEVDKYLGRELTYDDLENMIGQQVLYRSATVSHTWYKVVRITKMLHNDTMYEGYNRRLVYCDKPKPRKGDNAWGYVSEYWNDVDDEVRGVKFYTLDNVI